MAITDIFINEMLDMIFTNVSRHRTFNAKETAADQYREESREEWLRRNTVQKDDE